MDAWPRMDLRIDLLEKSLEFHYLQNPKISIPRVIKFNVVIAPQCLRVRDRCVYKKIEK